MELGEYKTLGMPGRGARLRLWLAVAGLMSAALMVAVAGCARQTDTSGDSAERTTTGQSRPSGSLQVKGSDTMVNLNQKWAEEYMKTNPGAQVAVTGGGSGTGIAAIINGTTDIAAASRQMKDEEISAAKAKGIAVQENVVGMDGLAVAVNPNNPVSELTIDQLADIFSGKVKNWKRVGGSDKDIVILSRESNSGTHVFFKEHVLNKGDSKGKVEYSPDAQLMPSSQAIADELKTNEGAIGYFGLGYVGDLKAVKVKKDAASPGVAPSVETVHDESYPIWRPLYWYLKEDATPLARDLLDWVKGEDGQKIVEDLEFVPL